MNMLRSSCARGWCWLCCNAKNRLKAVLTASLVVWLLASAAQAKYSGGSGTAEDPYQIATAADMNDIDNNPNDLDKYFLLTNDIDLSAYTGEQFNIISPFTGVFDGNGHTISNFTWSSTGSFAWVGLFAGLNDPNAVVKDLGLINPNIDLLEGAFMGVLVGELDSGTVSNCYVRGGSIRGEGIFGGLVGHNNGNISHCYSTCSATGTGNEFLDGNIGGLVGWNENGTISNSYATSTVSSEGDYDVDRFGGLVGGNEGTVINCYATGSVSGHDEIGGLVGVNWNGTVSNCYSIGNVSGTSEVGGLIGYNSGSVTASYSTGGVSATSNVGGLIGYNSGGTVTASFWDTQTSGQATSAGGTGKTTAEMKKENTFVNWDFVEIWNIGEKQTYPFLRVYPAGDLNHDGRVDFVDFAIMANNWQIGVE